MKSSASQLALLVAFAVLVGDYAFRTWQPPLVGEYKIGDEVQPLTASVSANPNKHLYLRRSWTLTEAPTYAWLKVLGHDSLQVFVNGRQVGRSQRVGFGRIGGDIVDITSQLHAGENTIAIHALQLVRNRPPAVAVEGECHFASGHSTSLSGTEGWLASDLYDRRGSFWYETDYPDEHWEQATVADAETWQAQVEVPPRAITTPRTASWIEAALANGGAATFATEFDLPVAPRNSWLRVAASGPYRLAVNGWIVKDDRLQLGTDASARPDEQTLDIAPLLRAGPNTIAIALTCDAGVPRIRGDFETTSGEQATYLATDSRWKSTPGIPENWMAPDLSVPGWHASIPAVGYMGMLPRAIQRDFGSLEFPTLFRVARFFEQLGVIATMAIFAVVGCAIVRRAVDWIGRSDTLALPASLPYWALLPSTVLAGGASLMTWDLAWSNHEIYRPFVLLGLLGLVVVLWLVLFVLSAWRPATKPRERQIATPAVGRLAFVFAWILLVVCAFWLRTREIVAEPMHHDEASAYKFTMSVFEHGFPGAQVHEDMPFTFCATSELTYYVNALFALFVDDPRLVVRLPSVMWSMATLLLIGYVANRWFNPYVALVAGFLFALSPHVIAMSNFGRYLSAIQFWTLLTTFLAFEAVRGVGKLRPALVWGAAFSFIAMYLTWEGTGLYGVGLALAALVHRRRHLTGVLSTAAVYPASVLVVLVVLGQNAHRILQQTQRLWYGTGISSMKLEPMWRFPFFDADYFLVNASWTADALLPTLAVVAACILVFKHRWRLPIRFLLICLLTNAGLMVVLLPLRTNRYSFHLTELVILLAAVVVVVIGDTLYQTVRQTRYPALRWYATAVTAPSVLVAVVLASGWAIRTSELTSYATSAQGISQLRTPDWEQPTRFVVNNYQPGDVVISILPHAQNFILSQMDDETNGVSVDYWLETRLVLQATIGDSHDVPRDRRSGAVMLYDLKQLKQLFADHDRIWYCTNRHGQSKINDTVVSRYLREHMDVVYEDLATAVLLRDRNHRSAELRLEEQKAGQLASEFYLN